MQDLLKKAYLYEEYFVDRYEYILKDPFFEKFKGLLLRNLNEEKKHVEKLSKFLKDKMDDSTKLLSWVLESVNKNNKFIPKKVLIENLFTEEVDLRNVYKNMLNGIKDNKLKDLLEELIVDEEMHEKRLKEILEQIK